MEKNNSGCPQQVVGQPELLCGFNKNIKISRQLINTCQAWIVLQNGLDYEIRYSVRATVARDLTGFENHWSGLSQNQSTNPA
jgi:hypothetical protein